MKKFFVTFLAMAMLSFSFITSAQAVDMKAFLKSIENIRNEYLRIQEKNDLRDFEFLLTMSIAQVTAWDQAVGKPNIKKEKMIEISKQFTAIISSQYISMQKYLQRYVIGKSPNKEQTKKNCSQLLQYINQGLTALKN